ncbi:MAG TPA: glycosyltransferase [Bacilli bacterium]|nr:glycosyltransferase [Bacilli bacterium]
MKIAFINSFYHSGSTGDIVFELAQYCRQQGHEVKVFYGRGQKVDKQEAIKIEGITSLLWHKTMAFLFDKEGAYSRLATKRLVNELKVFHPDVVNIHNLHGHYLSYSLLFAYFQEEKIKVIWTLHDSWAFTGHCPFPDTYQCAKYKTACYQCPGRRDYPASFIDRSKQNYLLKKQIFTRALRLHFICPSNYMQGQLKSSFLSAYPSSVIHNGISSQVPLLHKKEVSFEKPITTILAIANVWDFRKNIKDINHLASLLNADQEIILVGKIKGNINIDRRVKTIGFIADKEEIKHLYRSSSVVFNPSIGDNFPSINLEALANGTPIIAYDVGGNKEIINEHNGLLLQSSDPLRFEKMLTFISNQLFLMRDHISLDTKFSVDNFCKNYLAYFNQVMEEKR